jgi:hypothetical protein
MPYQMPYRLHSDGDVDVRRLSPNTLEIAVTDHGEEQLTVLSEYNAARVLAHLARQLGIELPKGLKS